MKLLFFTPPSSTGLVIDFLDNSRRKDSGKGRWRSRGPRQPTSRSEDQRSWRRATTRVPAVYMWPVPPIYIKGINAQRALLRASKRSKGEGNRNWGKRKGKRKNKLEVKLWQKRKKIANAPAGNRTRDPSKLHLQIPFLLSLSLSLRPFACNIHLIAVVGRQWLMRDHSGSSVAAWAIFQLLRGQFPGCGLPTDVSIHRP